MAYWKSSQGREIDFVIPRVDQVQRRFPIEVKGDSTAQISHAKRAIRQTFGRGIVASRTVFDWDEQVATIPVPILLASLKEQPERTRAVA